MFGQLGCLLFTIIGGNIYDTIGPSAPFIMLAIMDSIILVLVVLLIALGKLKN